jgi:hypothetical protein
MNRSQQTLLLTALAAGIAIGVLGKVHAQTPRPPLDESLQAKEPVVVLGPPAGMNAALAGQHSFSFSLGAGDTMTVAVSASAASAGTRRLNLAVVKLSTGARVLDFHPAPSDASGNYDPGQLLFAATSDMLQVAERYRLTVGQPAMPMDTEPQATPEPGTLAVCACGLLTLGLLRRRRLRSRLSYPKFLF